MATIIEMSPSDSIFDSGADVLVNPVNCVGVCGKGLALEFRKRFPENYVWYRQACSKKHLQMGKVLIFPDVFREEDRYIIKYIANFPTKQHWTNKSKLEEVAMGMYDLVARVNTMHFDNPSAFRSLAIPALGCGLGGLSWADVKPEISLAVERLPDTKVYLYPPKEEA